MTAQLDLFTEPESQPVHECVTHAVLPDMSVACCEDVLEIADDCTNGGHMAFGDWSRVTCPWCHSLGRAYYSATARRMQGRAA